MTGFVLQEYDRHEDRHGGRRGCQQCAPDLRGATLGSLVSFATCLPLPENVFQYDDRCIQNHAGCKGQGSEGDDVDGSTGYVHHKECDKQAQGDGQSHDQRRPEPAQEPPQHDHREGHAQQQVIAHHPDRSVDVIRLVVILRDHESGPIQLVRL